jgi:hypothetical protein
VFTAQQPGEKLSRMSLERRLSRELPGATISRDPVDPVLFIESKIATDVAWTRGQNVGDLANGLDVVGGLQHHMLVNDRDEATLLIVDLQRVILQVPDEELCQWLDDSVKTWAAKFGPDSELWQMHQQIHQKQGSNGLLHCEK